MTPLAGRSCEHRTRGLTLEAARTPAAELPGRSVSTQRVTKDSASSPSARTLVFVNAVAFIGHGEDRHLDIACGHGLCRVIFSTHATGGRSENHPICAAKVEATLVA